MTTRTITATEHLTVLTHLATGKAHHVVATITKLNVVTVQELADEAGYPDRDALAAAVAQLEEEIEQVDVIPVRAERRPAASSTTPDRPAVGDSTPPAAGPDLRSTTKVGTPEDPFPRVDDEQTARLRALINTAKGIPTRKVQRQLERALDALTTLAEYVKEDTLRNAEKRREAEEKAAARAEVERLEQQLRDAKAKLRRPVGTRSSKPAGGSHGRGLVTAAQLEELGVSSKEVRTWAHDNNTDCPNTGRLPVRVLDAWKAAHADEAQAS